MAADGGSSGESPAGCSDGRPRRRLRAVVAGGPLPERFERRWLVLAPGVEQPAEAGEWAGAIVLIERGRLEVCCAAGARTTYEEGHLLPLGWLPLLALRNPGAVETRLVAIRRRAGDRG